MTGLLVMVLAAKMWLIRRININWDEFHYLELVHSVLNGTPVPLLQTLHVRFFTWLPFVGVNEACQVIAARYALMVGVLATTFMLWRLACLWVVGWASWVAPLSYLLALPVFKHAASFRSDSLLAPLTTAVVLLICGGRQWSRLVVAAVLYGLSLAISIKAVLAAPMLLAILVLLDGSGLQWSLRRTARCVVVFACVTATAAALWLGLHRLFLVPSEIPVLDLMNRAASKTVLEQHWFPTGWIFQNTWRVDRTIWLLIAMGVPVALLKRQFVPVAFVLGLLPLIFYRNAFPYYYVVMLTPATVLAAIGASGVFGLLERWQSLRLSSVVLWCAFLTLFVAKFSSLLESRRTDRVSHQVAIIEAVHQAFPEPVPYIDHSGMVASFPKANFFMSSWGMAEYHVRGKPFTDQSVTDIRAPLVLANRGILDPDSKMFGWLLPGDREVLSTRYISFWGPMRVAGAEGVLCAGGRPRVFTLPYPGRYRIESDVPVLVGDQVATSGMVLSLGTSVSVSDSTDPECKGGVARKVTLIDARVSGRPTGLPPVGVIYDGL